MVVLYDKSEPVNADIQSKSSEPVINQKLLDDINKLYEDLGINTSQVAEPRDQFSYTYYWFK